MVRAEAKKPQWRNRKDESLVVDESAGERKAMTPEAARPRGDGYVPRSGSSAQ